MTLKFSQVSKTAPAPVDLSEAKPGDTFLDRSDGSIAVFVGPSKRLVWFYPNDPNVPVAVSHAAAERFTYHAAEHFVPCDLELLVTPR